MANNENYIKNPAGKLVSILKKEGWSRVAHKWEKGPTQLEIDELGIFLLREKSPGHWVQVRGLSFYSMRNFSRGIIRFYDGWELCLKTGAFTLPQ
jgi:hypothetical protein